MKTCFLCGSEYDETNRKTAAKVIFTDGQTNENTEGTTSINRISSQGKILQICPHCVRAAVLGLAINGGGFSWVGDILYEEDDEDA